MSGCIVGQCEVCGDHVFETDWDGPIMEEYYMFVHEKGCKKKFHDNRIIKQLKEDINRLRVENHELKSENKRLKKNGYIGQISLDLED
ncbi:hypothetical protein [Priestia aryabhattai]